MPQSQLNSILQLDKQFSWQLLCCYFLASHWYHCLFFQIHGAWQAWKCSITGGILYFHLINKTWVECKKAIWDCIMHNSNPKPEVCIWQERTEKDSILKYSRACRIRSLMKVTFVFSSLWLWLPKMWISHLRVYLQRTHKDILNTASNPRVTMETDA